MPRMRRPLRLLVTAGPTREPIDAVRFISNYSTGYLGALLAGAALRRGHQVTVICGPITEAMPRRARCVRIATAAELASAVRREAPGADAIIMAAAVADFRPAKLARGKLVRRGLVRLRLEPTPDVIGGLRRRAGQVVAGFALETGQPLKRAARKLREKRLDLIVAQQAASGKPGAGSPFGRSRVQAWMLARPAVAGRRLSVTRLGRISKPRLARVLLDKIEAVWYGQPESNAHAASS